jgi:hypothetical protein
LLCPSIPLPRPEPDTVRHADRYIHNPRGREWWFITGSTYGGVAPNPGEGVPFGTPKIFPEIRGASPSGRDTAHKK